MKRFIILIILFFQIMGCQSAPTVPGQVTELDADTAVSLTDTSPTGKLIFIEVDVGEQFISEYDLQMKTVNRLFTSPENGWISQIDILPDSSQLLMAYAPPPPEGEIQFGYTDIYLTVPDETAVPQPYIQNEHPDGLVFNPAWSPDAMSIYYSRITPDEEDSSQFALILERWDTVTGDILQIVPEGIWPTISPSGERIAYVTVDPQSLGNALWVAHADGSEPRPMVTEGVFEVVDVPLFSPDEEWLYFTAAENRETAVNWWEWFLGVQLASAHNIPSDWYRIPVTGGDIEQLTTIQETGIYGDFSPDGNHIAFATFNGLYLMNPNGSELEKILDIGATASLSWIN